MELGGSITLNGFEKRDYAELIIVKKIVGRYTRQITDTHTDFSHLAITLNSEDKTHTITAHCDYGAQSAEGTATDGNLFIALDTALKALVKKF